jgi:hypothetical protein
MANRQMSTYCRLRFDDELIRDWRVEGTAGRASVRSRDALTEGTRR